MTNGLARHLMDEAHAIATELHQRKQQHEKQRAKLEDELVVVRTQLEATSAAPGRLKEFGPMLRSQEDLCPECWIRRGQKHSVKPVSNPDDNDLFRCPNCNAQFSVAA